MVRHDHERLQSDTRKMSGDFKPALANDSPKMGEMNAAVFNSAEEASFFMGADRHEIQAGLSVVISLETDGTTLQGRSFVVHRYD